MIYIHHPIVIEQKHHHFIPVVGGSNAPEVFVPVVNGSNGNEVPPITVNGFN